MKQLCLYGVGVCLLLSAVACDSGPAASGSGNAAGLNLDTLMAGLESENPEARVIAATTLGGYPEYAERSALRLQQLSDDDPDSRVQAAAQMALDRLKSADE